MEENIFYINGYWKDDNSEFYGYKVTDYDGVEIEDDDIFFYGLSEKDIIEAIESGEETGEDFVITSYFK